MGSNGKKRYVLIGVVLLEVLLPMVLYYSFNPFGFGLPSILEMLLKISFFILGLGSSLTVLMRKDLGAKRVLAIFGLVVILGSTFALYNIVVFVVSRSSYYPPELFIVAVFFIIAGARLLISGVFYMFKRGNRT